MSTRGSDREGGKSAAVRSREGYPHGQLRLRSWGTLERLYIMCLKSIPLKGKEAQGFPRQLPSLISRGSLVGSPLPGTLGRKG